MLMGVIGAMFGFEPFRDIPHHSTLMLQHMGNNMIAPDEDAVLVDLRLEMAVADMPCQLREMSGIAAAHLTQLFLGGDHFDEAAVLKDEPVAVLEPGRSIEIDKQIATVPGTYELAPQMPRLRIEHDAVEGRGTREPGAAEGCCSQPARHRQ